MVLWFRSHHAKKGPTMMSPMSPMSPDESTPASRDTHARHNFSQRLSLLSGSLSRSISHQGVRASLGYLILVFRFVGQGYFWTSDTAPLECSRWFIREGLLASLTRRMHQSTEKTIPELSPQILVAALRPWQLATARRKSHLNPRFRRANCPRTGVLPRRTAAQSFGLAPAISRLSPQQSSSIF